MRLLVTGCAGFIASRVTEALVRNGHEVVGVDNLNDAYDPRLKEWRLGRLRALSGFSWHSLDILERGALLELLPSHPVKAVLNLAARAGVRQSLVNPWIYYATNVTGILNLLELCRELGTQTFVLASTSSLYAGNEGAFREDLPTDRPLSRTRPLRKPQRRWPTRTIACSASMWRCCGTSPCMGRRGGPT